MSVHYKALRDAPEFDAKKGETFELDVTADVEGELVAAGRVELVPRSYRVVGGSIVDGHNPGEEFNAAMTLAREALLVAGGHIERLTPPTDTSRAKPKEAKQ